MLDWNFDRSHARRNALFRGLSLLLTGASIASLLALRHGVNGAALSCIVISLLGLMLSLALWLRHNHPQSWPSALLKTGGVALVLTELVVLWGVFPVYPQGRYWNDLAVIAFVLFNMATSLVAALFGIKGAGNDAAKRAVAIRSVRYSLMITLMLGVVATGLFFSASHNETQRRRAAALQNQIRYWQNQVHYQRNQALYWQRLVDAQKNAK